MKHPLSDKAKSALFGKLYVTDERVQAGSDKAGNHAFAAVFACLMLGLLYSLFFAAMMKALFAQRGRRTRLRPRMTAYPETSRRYRLLPMRSVRPPDASTAGSIDSFGSPMRASPAAGISAVER